MSSCCSHNTGGKCGAQLRSDGKQGTEVWFTLPLIPVDDGRGTEKTASTGFSSVARPIPTSTMVFVPNDLALGRVRGVYRTPTTKTRSVSPTYYQPSHHNTSIPS